MKTLSFRKQSEISSIKTWYCLRLLQEWQKMSTVTNILRLWDPDSWRPSYFDTSGPQCLATLTPGDLETLRTWYLETRAPETLILWHPETWRQILLKFNQYSLQFHYISHHIIKCQNQLFYILLERLQNGRVLPWLLVLCFPRLSSTSPRCGHHPQHCHRHHIHYHNPGHHPQLQFSQTSFLKPWF